MRLLKIIACLPFIYIGLMVVFYGYLGGPGLKEVKDHMFTGQCFRTTIELELYEYKVAGASEERFTKMDLPPRFLSNAKNYGNVLEALERQNFPVGSYARMERVYTYLNRTVGLPATY